MTLAYPRKLSPKGHHLNRSVKDLLPIAGHCLDCHVGYVLLQEQGNVAYLIVFADPNFLGEEIGGFFLGGEVGEGTDHFGVEVVQGG